MQPTPSLINVPLLSPNQAATQSGGPIGRIESLFDGQVRKFIGQGGQAQLRVEKRNGFTQFPNTVRDPANGSTSSKSVLGATSMGTLGNKLVAAASAAMFVLSESAGCYESPQAHCPMQGLRMRNLPMSFVAGTSAVNTPDSARIGTRTFYTWTNVYVGSTTANFMIVDDDGTLIRKSIDFTGGASMRVKCVADTSNSRFWMVFADNGAGLQVQAFDLNGVLLATDSDLTPVGDTYWDVIACPFQTFAINVVFKTIAASTFTIAEFDYNSGPGTITHTDHVVAGSLASTGRVAYIRNDRGTTDQYIVGITGAGPFDYHCYQVDNTYTIQHTYTIATGQTPMPHEISGYVAPTGNADITVALGFVDVGTLPGPFTFRNYTATYVVTFAGASTNPDTRNGLTPVTRPFRMNGTYYIVLFYQADLSVLTPVAQSTFFLFHLAPNYEICGRWEFGVAYGDWQKAGSTPFWLHLSTPTVDPTGAVHLGLTYRARNFTSHAVSGTSSSSDARWHNTITSAISVRDYILAPLVVTDPVEASGELLFSGPQAVAYSGGSFVDDGIPLIPEIITVLGSVTVGQMTTGGTYEYVVSAEWTDDAGNLVRGPIGPGFTITLTGGRNAADITITNIHVSPNKTNLRLIIGRTVWSASNLGGAQSTIHHKVISDLSPLINNDASMSVTYTDVLSDAALAVNEEIYTDKQFLDRFPAPAGPGGGCATADRMFVPGYDNAIWFSGPKTEGDAWWFTPEFRIPLPTSEPITKCVIMDNFLIVFCATSNVFAVPIATLPDASGAGPFPTPIELPFSNGCTGYAAVTDDGVMYSSVQGGIWLVTRALKNEYISIPMIDDIEGASITGMTVDKNQRVYVVLNSSGRIAVYDQICKQWSKWQPSSNPLAIVAHKGLLAFSASDGIWQQTPAQYADINAVGTQFYVAVTIVLAKMYFGALRGFVRLWDAQLEGEYIATHTLTVSAASYVDDIDTSPVFTTYSFTPVAGQPYVFQLPPNVEELSHVKYSIIEGTNGLTNSQGFALEGMAFEVGIDPRLGRVSTARQIKGL